MQNNRPFLRYPWPTICSRTMPTSTLVYPLILLFHLCVGWTALGQSPHPPANPVMGLWRNAAGNALIQIQFTPEGKLEGRGAAGLGDPNRKDIKNPDPQQKNRPLLGALILWGFQPANPAHTEWRDGKIYDPDTGNTYSAMMQVDNHRLLIRGYLGIPLFGRTTCWTREK